MIEHMRQEKTVVNQLYGGLARLIETARTAAGPGRVEIRIGEQVVGMGGDFRQALTHRSEANEQAHH